MIMDLACESKFNFDEVLQVINRTASKEIFFDEDENI